MSSGWTNRGLKCILNTYFRADTTDEPEGFKLALITAGTPGADTNTMSGLTELANANGYTTDGKAVARSSAGFDVIQEDDENDRAYIQLADVTWDITGSGVSGITYALLMDDAATPNVIAFFDLNGPVSQVAGQPLTIQNAELRQFFSDNPFD